MKKQKMTEWMPLSTPPVRFGVYEVRPPSGGAFPYPFGYWNGQAFYGCDDTPLGAYRSKDHFSYSLSDPSNYWRGLARDPNKA